MNKKEKFRSFRRHVIRGRQGTDSRLRSFRAEPFSEQIHKLVFHENVNFLDKNGWLFLAKNRNSKALETGCLFPAHDCDTVSKGRGKINFGNSNISQGRV